jgi:murein L,D-transpeptidase YafK
VIATSYPPIPPVPRRLSGVAWLAGVVLAMTCLLAPPQLHAAEKADMVRVVKSKNRLYLLKDEQVFASYRVKFGGDAKGHKQQQGDQKTPEGLYFLTYKNSNSSFYRSIHVSYPNAEDKENARKLGVDPGGDIMIHGQANGWEWATFFAQMVNWTDGCIALTNKDMDSVWAAIDPGTPIEILP